MEPDETTEDLVNEDGEAALLPAEPGDLEDIEPYRGATPIPVELGEERGQG